jgi:nitrogen regulatory protein PII
MYGLLWRPVIKKAVIDNAARGGFGDGQIFICDGLEAIRIEPAKKGKTRCSAMKQISAD